MKTDPSQGEALGARQGAVTLAVLITYSRLDATELYNVSHEGLAGGLGRALVLLNFPVALVAVPLALLAVAALSSKAWLVAGPAIGLCAMVPFTVDQDDLDARWINAFPALGVVLALCSTIAAARRAGRSFASRRTGDPLRLVVAAVVVVLSSRGWPQSSVFIFPATSSSGRSTTWKRTAGGSPRFIWATITAATEPSSSSPPCSFRASACDPGACGWW